MDVEDGLPGAAAGVEDGAVAVEVLLGGDGLGLAQDVRGERGVGGGEGGRVAVVRLGDDEDVSGGLGVYVAEREGGVGLADDGGGNPTRDDLAEQAVVLRLSGHGVPPDTVDHFRGMLSAGAAAGAFPPPPPASSYGSAGGCLAGVSSRAARASRIASSSWGSRPAAWSWGAITTSTSGSTPWFSTPHS